MMEQLKKERFLISHRQIKEDETKYNSYWGTRARWQGQSNHISSEAICDFLLIPLFGYQFLAELHSDSGVWIDAVCVSGLSVVHM